MKRLPIMIPLAAIAMALAACSANDEGTGSGMPIRLGASAVVTANVQTRTEADIPQDALFDANEQVDVFVTDLSGVETYAQPMVYTAGAASAGVNPLTPATQQYYGTGNISIKAYYPHAAIADPTAAATFTVAADQTTTANYKASDLMAGSLTSQAPTTSAVNLSFSHLLTRFVVDLDQMTGFTAADIKSITVSAKRQASVSISQVATATGEASDVTVCGEGVAKGVCILPAQTIAAGTALITVTLKDDYTGGPKVIKYKPVQDLTLATGNTYYLKMAASNVVITGYTYAVSAWPNPAVTYTGSTSSDYELTSSSEYVQWLLTWLNKVIRGTETVTPNTESDRNLNWTPNY